MMAHLALYASIDHRCDSTSALQTIVREPWPITLMPLMWSYFLQITYTPLKILPRSMPSSEHLPLVPFHKPFTRIIFFHLRQRDLFPAKSQNSRCTTPPPFTASETTTRIFSSGQSNHDRTLYDELRTTPGH